MLVREYLGQKGGDWHNYVLQNSKHDDHVSYPMIYSIQGVFQSAYGNKSFSILKNLEDFKAQNHNEIATKLTLKKGKQGDVRSGDDNTETSNQSDICVTRIEETSPN